jgi:hypothetical protein
MIDFADGNEDFEKTQLLPALTPDVQLDEALRRERGSRIEIEELMRRNVQQAKEIEQLRGRIRVLFPLARQFSHANERRVTAEEGLFEVCGALKDMLSKVMEECGTRGLALHCGNAARRTFEDSCDKLERILSAPGFSAREAPADIADGLLLERVPPGPEFAFRAKSPLPGRSPAPAAPTPSLRVLHLELVRPDAKARVSHPISLGETF